nr:ABC transporter permease [Neiella litorisoli]
MFIREIRSKFSDKFGVSWAVLEPLTFILIMSYGRSLIAGGKDTHSMPTFVFMMYGMLLLQLFLSTFSSSASAVKRNKPLYAFRQVQPISAVLAALLMEVLTKVLMFGFILFFMFFAQIEIRIDDALSLVMLTSLLAIFAFSFGLLFGLAELYVPEMLKVRQILTRPLFFVSGVFFSLQDMPQQYWHYLNWNPILHAIELARQAAYSSFGAQGVSASFLIMSTLAACILSLSVYHAFWKGAISR